MEIFERTYGKGSFQRSSEYSYYAGKSRSEGTGMQDTAGEGGRGRQSHRSAPGTETKEKCLIVDGYNIIFAWGELKELAEKNIDAARDRLMDILCNYQGFRGMKLLLVFDGYRVRGNSGEVFKFHNIDVVYTREGETADQYIEKTVLEAGKELDITVATSDRLEQISIFSHGAHRMPAAELYTIVEETAAELRHKYLNDPAGIRGTSGGLFAGQPELQKKDPEDYNKNIEKTDQI